MTLFLGNYYITPSGPRSVVNLSNTEQATEECSEVSFNDNTSIILSRSSSILSDTGYLEASNHKRFRHHEILPVEYDRFNQECLDPYLIGVLCNTKCRYNEFFTSEPKFKDLPGLCSHFNISVSSAEGQLLKINNNKEYLNIFTPFLTKTGLSSRLRYRHIPENYLYSNLNSRKELLAGITDANVKVDGAFCIEVSSVQLAKDIAFLIRSLGGVARVTRYTSKDPWYKIVFSVNFNPFKLKQCSEPTTQLKKRVVGIKNLGQQPVIEAPFFNLIINDFITVN